MTTSTHQLCHLGEAKLRKSIRPLTTYLSFFLIDLEILLCQFYHDQRFEQQFNCAFEQQFSHSWSDASQRRLQGKVHPKSVGPDLAQIFFDLRNVRQWYRLIRASLVT